MTDLIERLRRYAGSVCIASNTDLESADEIERLRKELEYAKLAAEAEARRVDALKAELDTLRAELDALKSQESITAVQDDHNADGRSQRIYDYLPAGTQLYAAPKPGDEND